MPLPEIKLTVEAVNAPLDSTNVPEPFAVKFIVPDTADKFPPNVIVPLDVVANVKTSPLPEDELPNVTLPVFVR